MEKKIKIIFEGNEEIIKVVESGRFLNKYIGLPNEGCPFIDANIKFIEKLGEGKYGAVFLIKIKDDNLKKYVVKKSYIKFNYVDIKKSEISEILKEIDIDWKTLLSLQLSSFSQEFEKTSDLGRVKILIPPNICKLSNYELFTSIPQIGDEEILAKILVPKGSYLCDDNLFSEYIIGAYIGKLYRDKICINFINMYSMFTCPIKDSTEKDVFQQYVFMDKIDVELCKCLPCISPLEYKKINLLSLNLPFNKWDIINGIFIQTMFAIATYQEHLKISHNDLHCGNIFIDYVTPDMIFNGQNIADANYFHYKIKGMDIYFPAISFIIKIGDFGLSVKYSKPIVGYRRIFEDGYSVITNEGDDSLIPNYYLPAYDSLYFTVNYGQFLSPNMFEGDLGNLITDCLRFMCPKIDKEDDQLYEELLNKNYIKENGRPILENLENVKNALGTLVVPIRKLYREKPISGKIVTLGIL
jgi:serine/threonine protein kinase